MIFAVYCVAMVRPVKCEASPCQNIGSISFELAPQGQTESEGLQPPLPRDSSFKTMTRKEQVQAMDNEFQRAVDEKNIYTGLLYFFIRDSGYVEVGKEDKVQNIGPMNEFHYMLVDVSYFPTVQKKHENHIHLSFSPCPEKRRAVPPTFLAGK